MSTTTTRPTPLLMARKRPDTVPTVPDRMPSRQEVGVLLDTDAPSRVVAPGGRRTVLVTTVDDGVRKAKQVQPGQRVQPFIHGVARGGVRVVESVERIEDNTLVRITFSSGHPAQDYKPAYRFIDLDAVGKEITVRQSTFVAVAR